MTDNSTIQSWVHELTRMQQAVLLTAIRGPDGLPGKHAAKALLRWYRRCILVTAFEGTSFGKSLCDAFAPGGGNFTGPVGVEPALLVEDSASRCLDDALLEYLETVDELPHHFYLHFLHASEVLGYKHPVEGTREWWRRAYYRMVRKMHLTPETEAEMDSRLGDSETDWRRASVDEP